MTKRILLVEDDESLGFVTKDSLENKGFSVVLCHDGEKGFEIFEAQDFDICLFDIMLPKQDGFALAKKVRAINKQTPILFLTAKGMQEDKLKGFEVGADDYITKPFSIEELIYRIEVFLKRGLKIERSKTRKIGRYQLDLTSFILSIDDNSKKLTRREVEILQYLSDRSGTIVERNEILNALWGDDDYFKGRSLDVFISKLRKYLKDDSNVDIENYHGVGFRLLVTT